MKKRERGKKKKETHTKRKEKRQTNRHTKKREENKLVYIIFLNDIHCCIMKLLLKVFLSLLIEF